jgi:FdhE protein
MQRTAPGLRTDPATRLADLERQRPEWHAWLKLLGQVEHALGDDGWPTPLSDAELGAISNQSPLLNGRTLEVDADRVQRLVRRLASTAAAGHLPDASSLRRYQPSMDEAMGLLAAAIRQDRDGIGELATNGNVDPGALTSVAHLAALPLLRSCGRLLGDRVPRSWPHGYCPICAAWPILAERRGLDRSRRLRCGRCSGEWEIQWLCCVYCGNREHERLGSMIPEDRGERLKVETCLDCRGYLKSFATLQAIPHFELLLHDLETIELDLVALDRGYQRPQGLGFSLDVRLVDHASG